MSDKKLPKVCIVVLNWNNYEDTSRCLENLSNLEYENYSIVLVDNNSTDGSGDLLEEEFMDREEYTIIMNENNLGFAGGINVGIEDAITKSAEYVLLLNNDMVVEPGSLWNMVETAEKETCVAAVGGIIYLEESHEIQTAGGKFRSWDIINTYKSIPEKDVVESEFVSGGFALISTGYLISNGLFNEDYFFGFEDVEFSWRAVNDGWRLMIDRKAVARHKGSATAGNYSPFRVYHRMRNRLYFVTNHFPAHHQAIFCSYLIISQLFRFLQWFPNKRQRIRATLVAIYHHLIDFDTSKAGPNYFRE